MFKEEVVCNETGLSSNFHTVKRWKNTVLIEVPDLEILTEGLGMADAVEMARDAIGLKGNGSYKNNQSNCKDVHLK